MGVAWLIVIGYNNYGLVPVGPPGTLMSNGRGCSLIGSTIFSG